MGGVRPIAPAGQRFGKLVVLGGMTDAQNRTKWLCRCDCGKAWQVRPRSVNAGTTRSCGCGVSLIKHGEAKNPTFIYRIWGGMISRCTNPKHPAYANYGGRGITVCDRWRYGAGGLTGYEHFRADVGPRPSRSHSLDRRDNDGNYEPTNIRWATNREQSRNQRCTTLVDWNGEKRLFIELCEEAGITTQTVRSRLKRGWPIEAAISTPPGRRGKVANPRLLAPNANAVALLKLRGLEP